MCLAGLLDAEDESLLKQKKSLAMPDSLIIQQIDHSLSHMKLSTVEDQSFANLSIASSISVNRNMIKEQYNYLSLSHDFQSGVN